MAPIQTPAVKEPSLPVKLLTAGTAACVADLITFPLDTAKVRLQVIKSLGDKLHECNFVPTDNGSNEGWGGIWLNRQLISGTTLVNYKTWHLLCQERSQ